MPPFSGVYSEPVSGATDRRHLNKQEMSRLKSPPAPTVVPVSQLNLPPPSLRRLRRHSASCRVSAWSPLTRDALLSLHSKIQLLLFALFVIHYYSLLFHPILNSFLCFPLSPFHILSSLLSSLLFSFLPSLYSPLLSLLIFYFLSHLLFPFPILPPSPAPGRKECHFSQAR